MVKKSMSFTACLTSFVHAPLSTTVYYFSENSFGRTLALMKSMVKFPLTSKCSGFHPLLLSLSSIEFSLHKSVVLHLHLFLPFQLIVVVNHCNVVGVYRIAIEVQYSSLVNFHCDCQYTHKENLLH